MSNATDTQELRYTEIIIEQLRGIAEDIKQLPRIVAQLEILGKSQERLEQTLKDNVKALTRRDEHIENSVRDLELRNHELNAALNMMVSDIKDLQRTLGNIENIRQCSEDFYHWLPWLRGLKWFSMAVGGVFVTALAVALLWSIVNSGAGLR